VNQKSRLYTTNPDPNLIQIIQISNSIRQHKTQQTFCKRCQQNAVMVRLFLLAETNENGILDVTSDVGQHLNARVHFTLKEAEQRVTDVLHRALHWCQCLQTMNGMLHDTNYHIHCSK